MLRIRDILKEKGIKQSDLAKKIGVKQETISRQISGNPTLDTLEKIATALDVDIKELFVNTKELSKEDLLNDIRQKLDLLEDKK